MTARLEPASEGAMIDQKNALPCFIENESRCGDMARERAPQMNVVPVLDLLSQQGMPVAGNLEGMGIAIEQAPDLLAKGGRVESAGHHALSARARTEW
jgi:hypothetical protein